jgi:hypothetical protein
MTAAAKSKDGRELRAAFVVAGGDGWGSIRFAKQNLPFT